MHASAFSSLGAVTEAPCHRVQTIHPLGAGGVASELAADAPAYILSGRPGSDDATRPRTAASIFGFRAWSACAALHLLPCSAARFTAGNHCRHVEPVREG
jgi:hypothetical protein